MTKLVTTVDLPYINFTGPQAHYLDQGLWAISVETPTPMEVKCKDHSHVKTLEPPFTLINLVQHILFH